MTPEQNQKMEDLNKLARKRGRIIALKCMGMLAFVALTTLALDVLFVQSNVFAFLANVSGGILILIDTSANMKIEIEALEKEAQKILEIS